MIKLTLIGAFCQLLGGILIIGSFWHPLRFRVSDGSREASCLGQFMLGLTGIWFGLHAFTGNLFKGNTDGKITIVLLCSFLIYEVIAQVRYEFKLRSGQDRDKEGED